MRGCHLWVRGGLYFIAREGILELRVGLGTKEGKLHITKASAGHTRVGWRPRERTGKWLPG